MDFENANPFENLIVPTFWVVTRNPSHSQGLLLEKGTVTLRE